MHSSGAAGARESPRGTRWTSNPYLQPTMMPATYLLASGRAAATGSSRWQSSQAAALRSRICSSTNTQNHPATCNGTASTSSLVLRSAGGLATLSESFGPRGSTACRSRARKVTSCKLCSRKACVAGLMLVCSSCCRTTPLSAWPVSASTTSGRGRIQPAARRRALLRISTTSADWRFPSETRVTRSLWSYHTVLAIDRSGAFVKPVRAAERRGDRAARIVENLNDSRGEIGNVGVVAGRVDRYVERIFISRTERPRDARVGWRNDVYRRSALVADDQITARRLMTAEAETLEPEDRESFLARDKLSVRLENCASYRALRRSNA